MGSLGKRGAMVGYQPPKKFRKFKKEKYVRNYIPRHITLEKKVIDVNYLAQVHDGGSLSWLLNGCVQGTDIINRVGRRIMLKSVLVRLIFNVDVASTPISQTWRVAIIYDKQTNATYPPGGSGSQPTVGATFFKPVVGSSSYISPLNIDQRDRFEIISDEHITLSKNGPEEVALKIYRKLNHEVTFNSGNSGIYSDIVTGALWINLYNNVSSSNAAGFNLSSRVRFEDA